jgi:hypothetical protein
MKRIIIILGIIIIVLLGVLLFVPAAKGPTVPGNASSSTPPIVSSDGHVAVLNLRSNDAVSSPLAVSGTVTGGGWFFEASFPVKVIDADGTVLGQGPAQAQGDWMTTGTVPFSATILFSKPHSVTGTVVFAKDNPSGMPQNDLSLTIPISFVKQAAAAGNVTVSGKVVLGPTCPVERIPPDPACAPKPYQTTISVIKVGSPSGAPFKTVQTDASGDFSVSLPTGLFALQPSGGSPYPRCGTSEITVPSTGLAGITLNCDTGIR